MYDLFSTPTLSTPVFSTSFDALPINGFRHHRIVLFKRNAISIAILAMCAVLSSNAAAASFVIVDGQVETNPQALVDNEVGIIEAGGQLNIGTGIAVDAIGDNVTINNSGLISTTGVAGGAGIITFGNNADINNSGTITTSAFSARAIASEGGNNNTINNSGLLSTLGDDATTISSGGDGDIITNSGTITTSGSSSEAIESFGENATITNSGTITTSGFSARAIDSDGGDNVTIDNSGLISTTGVAATGIITLGNNAVTNNSGTITTSGNSSTAIFFNGDTATINNSGVLSTTGVDAKGINVFGDNVTIINSGHISTTGTGAGNATGIKIVTQAPGSVVINSGSISITGDNADGIHVAANALAADSITVVNSGSISTKGDFSSGILSSFDNATITNSGSIKVSGNGSIGVEMFGENVLTTVSGSILATGNADQAVSGGAGSQTLTLLPDAQILGSVDLGDDIDTANIIGGGLGPSSTITFENVEIINVSGGALQDGNTVTRMDPTGQAANDTAMALHTFGLHQSINQQLNFTPSPKNIQVAASRLSPEMLKQDASPYAWGRFFGSDVSRNVDGNVLAYDYADAGIIGGYESNLGSHRVGILAGFSQSNIKTDVKSIKTDSKHFFAGVYGQHVMTPAWALNGSVIIGHGDHKIKRSVVNNLAGIETSKGNYDSRYISPSVTLAGHYDWHDSELRPSVQMSYTYGRYDSYREKGSQSNLKIDDRRAKIFGTQLQLAWARPYAEGRGEFEMRGGVRYRHMSNDDVDATFGSSEGTIGIDSDDNVAGLYVGTHIHYAIQDSLNFVGDVEFGHASGSESFITGNVGLEFLF